MDVEMLPQPPPCIPAPPPNEAAQASRRRMKGILLLGLGSLLLFLLGSVVAPLMKSTHRHPITQALSNARQIGLALFDFDSDYSRLPDASTTPMVQAATHTSLDLSDSTSNGLFRQLIAAGIVSSEEIFYAQCHDSVKPDNHLGTGAIARGECGFSYILCGSNSVTGSSNRPVVVSPLIPGTLRFDPKPFDGRAVVLRMDNSAISWPIDNDGSVWIDGKDLFDPTQPYWGGSKPVVKWPDLQPLSWFYRHTTACMTGAIAAMAAVLSVVFLNWKKKHELSRLSTHASSPLIGWIIAVSGLFLSSHSAFARKTASTQALSNARQIGLALFDFDGDYSRFPDVSTIADVKKATNTSWDLKARTSNDLFKQLIAGGITTSEEIFFIKCFGSRKPDNHCTTDEEALAAGECGFAYIAGASSLCDPRRPLVVAPLIPGTLLFDPEAFDGKAVILYANNSAVLREIEPDGRVLAADGKDMFDPSQAYWKGAPVDVKWADLPIPPLSPPRSRNHVAVWTLVASIGVAWVGTISWLLVRKKSFAANPERDPR